MLKRALYIGLYLGVLLVFTGCMNAFDNSAQTPPKLEEHYKTLLEEYKGRMGEVAWRDQIILYISNSLKSLDDQVGEHTKLVASYEANLKAQDCFDAESDLTLGLGISKENIYRTSKNLSHGTLEMALRTMKGQTMAYDQSQKKAMEKAFSEMKKKIEPGLVGINSMIEDQYFAAYNLYINKCEQGQKIEKN